MANKIVLATMATAAAIKSKLDSKQKPGITEATILEIYDYFYTGAGQILTELTGHGQNLTGLERVLEKEGENVSPEGRQAVKGQAEKVLEYVASTESYIGEIYRVDETVLGYARSHGIISKSQGMRSLLSNPHARALSFYNLRNNTLKLANQATAAMSLLSAQARALKEKSEQTQ